jgi:xanthine dehydrogenase iron-sulfur cluster and FAD-binding subunit A
LDFNRKARKSQELEFVGNGIVWLSPRSKLELAQLLEDYPEAKIVSGCTSEKIRSVPNTVTSPNDIDIVFIDVTSLAELREVKITDTHVCLGAALTISEMETEILNLMETLPGMMIDLHIEQKKEVVILSRYILLQP